MGDSQETKAVAAAELNANLYFTKIPSEADSGRCLLEKYSNIAPEDVDAHIYEIVSGSPNPSTRMRT